MKKALCFLLCAVMLLGMLPASALAAENQETPPPETSGDTSGTQTASDGEPADTAGDETPPDDAGEEPSPTAATVTPESHEDTGEEHCGIEMTWDGGDAYFDKNTPEMPELPEGVSFDAASGTLTLSNANLTSLHFNEWGSTPVTLKVEGVNTITNGEKNRRALGFWRCHEITITGGGTLNLRQDYDDAETPIDPDEENPNYGGPAFEINDAYIDDPYWFSNPYGSVTIEDVTLNVVNDVVCVSQGYDELHDNTFYGFQYNTIPINFNIGNVKFVGATVSAAGLGSVSFNGNVTIDAESSLTLNAVNFSGFSDYMLAEGNSRTVTIDGELTVNGYEDDGWLDAYMDEHFPGVSADRIYQSLLCVGFGAEATVNDGAVITINNSGTNGCGLDIATINDMEEDLSTAYMTPGKLFIKGGTVDITIAGNEGICVQPGSTYNQTGGDVTIHLEKGPRREDEGYIGCGLRANGGNDLQGVGTVDISGGTLTIDVDVTGSVSGQDQGGNATGIYVGGKETSFSVSGTAKIDITFAGEFTGGWGAGFQGIQVQGYDDGKGGPWNTQHGSTFSIGGSASVDVDMSGIVTDENTNLDGVLVEYGSQLNVLGGSLNVAIPPMTPDNGISGITVDNSQFNVLGGEVNITLDSGDITTGLGSGVRVYINDDPHVVADPEAAMSGFTVDGGDVNITLSGNIRDCRGIDNDRGDIDISSGSVTIDMSGVTEYVPVSEDLGSCYIAINTYGTLTISGGTVDMILPNAANSNENGISSSGTVEITGGTVNVTGGTDIGENGWFYGLESVVWAPVDEYGNINGDIRPGELTISGSAKINVSMPSGDRMDMRALYARGGSVSVTGGTVNITVPSCGENAYVNVIQADTWMDNSYDGELYGDVTITGGTVNIVNAGEGIDLLPYSNLSVFSTYGGTMEIGGSAKVTVDLTVNADYDIDNTDDLWAYLFGFSVEDHGSLTISGSAKVDYVTDAWGMYQHFLNLSNFSSYNQSGGTMTYTPGGQGNLTMYGYRAPMGIYAEDHVELNLSGGSFTIGGVAGMGAMFSSASQLNINGGHHFTMDTFGNRNSSSGLYPVDSELTVSGDNTVIDLNLPTGNGYWGVAIQFNGSSAGNFMGGTININQGEGNRCVSLETDFRQGITVWTGSTLRISGGVINIRATQPICYSYQYTPSLTFADGICANVVKDGSSDRAMQLSENDGGDGWFYCGYIDPDVDLDDPKAEVPPDTDVVIKRQSSSSAQYEGSLELVNAGAITAGMTYNVRYMATLTTASGDVTFTFNGPALSPSADGRYYVTVNSQRREVSYSGGSFTVSINSGDIVRFEIVPTGSENTITAQVGKEEEKVTFTANAYTFSVPTQVKKPQIPVSGTAAAGATVDIYVGETIAQTVTASSAGNWNATVPVSEGENAVYVTVTPPGGAASQSDTYTVTYSPDAAVVETLTVTNWIHGNTSIDPNKPTTFVINYQTNTITDLEGSPVRYYIYWPELPEFTFSVAFADNSGTPDKVKDVTVVATDWLGHEQTVYLGYDSATGAWVGTQDFCDDQNITPEKFRVEWRSIGSAIDSGSIEAQAPGLIAEDYSEPDLSQEEDPDSLDYTTNDQSDTTFVIADDASFTVTLAEGVDAEDIVVETVVGSEEPAVTRGEGSVTVTGAAGDVYILYCEGSDAPFAEYDTPQLAVTFNGAGENNIKYDEHVLADDGAVFANGTIIPSEGNSLAGMNYVVIGNSIFRRSGDDTWEDVTDEELNPAEIYEELDIRSLESVDWGSVILTPEQKAQAEAAFIASPMMAAIRETIELNWKQEGKVSLEDVADVSFELETTVKAVQGSSLSLSIKPKFTVTVYLCVTKLAENVKQSLSVTLGIEYESTADVNFILSMRRDENGFMNWIPRVSGTLSYSTQGSVGLIVSATVKTEGEHDSANLDKSKYFDVDLAKKVLTVLEKSKKESKDTTLCEILIPIPVAPAVQFQLTFSLFADWEIFGEISVTPTVHFPKITTSVALRDNRIVALGFDMGDLSADMGLDFHAEASLFFGPKINVGFTVCKFIEISVYLKTGPEAVVKGHAALNFHSGQSTDISLEMGVETGWKIQVGFEGDIIKDILTFDVTIFETTIPIWEGGRKAMPTKFATVETEESGAIPVNAQCDLKNIIDLNISYQKLIGDLEESEQIMDLDKYSFELVTDNAPVTLTPQGGLTVNDTSRSFEFEVKVIYTVRENYDVWKIERLKYSPAAVTIVKTTEDGGPRDATFQIIDTNGLIDTVVTRSTGPDGMLVFDAVDGHTYVVTEISWPEGYRPVTTTQTVTASSEEPRQLDFTNVKIKPEEPPEEDKQRTQDKPIDNSGDPSGYVYEGIPSNRLSGVTVTVYEAEDSNGTGSKPWSEAADFDQSATLQTDLLGQYLWMVPSGWWQVKYEAEGYETQYSDWMDVPPVRTEVNHNMISTDPAAMTVEYSEELGALIVRFNRPVQVLTVREMIYSVAGENLGLNSYVTPVDGDWSVETVGMNIGSTYCATTFIIELEAWDNETGEPVDLAGETVSIDASGVKTYNDVYDVRLDAEKIEITGEPAEETYTVTVVNGIGSHSGVKAGETVTVTANPAPSGKEFDGWDVDCDVALTVADTATVTFIMPAADVTLTARYVNKYTPSVPSKPSKPDKPDEPEKPDITDPAVNGVAKRLDTVNHLAYIHGFDDGTMRPDASLTRAQAAFILYGLLLDKTPGEAVFEDVSESAYYYDAVYALHAKGIIFGRTDTAFCPDEPVKRAEFAAMCVRFADTIEAENKFTDVPDSYWAVKEISQAAAFGWITGRTASTFDPEAPISRAEAVRIINQMLRRSADRSQAASMPAFTDLSTSHWAYFELLEAAVPHSFTVTDGKETWTDIKE